MFTTSELDTVPYLEVPGFEPSENPEIGDVYELGRWFHPGQDLDFEKSQLVLSFGQRSRLEYVVIGGVEFEILDAENSRTPKPPPDRDMKYLVARSHVTRVLYRHQADFISTLDKPTLDKLRDATRRVVFRRDKTLISDQECDDIISELAPSIAHKFMMETLRGEA